MGGGVIPFLPPGTLEPARRRSVLFLLVKLVETRGIEPLTHP
ncbi:MAG TPA: hypothetical protein VFA63_04730 [Pseudonocardiaceae bacterium]|nr:hypothetical protein [Pseudonocardiaceae bacterium]